jgi:hypothetical protein
MYKGFVAKIKIVELLKFACKTIERRDFRSRILHLKTKRGITSYGIEQRLKNNNYIPENSGIKAFSLIHQLSRFKGGSRNG